MVSDCVSEMDIRLGGFNLCTIEVRCYSRVIIMKQLLFIGALWSNLGDGHVPREHKNAMLEPYSSWTSIYSSTTTYSMFSWTFLSMYVFQISGSFLQMLSTAQTQIHKTCLFKHFSNKMFHTEKIYFTRIYWRKGSQYALTSKPIILINGNLINRIYN